jgi:hypothetical protein
MFQAFAIVGRSDLIIVTGKMTCEIVISPIMENLTVESDCEESKSDQIRYWYDLQRFETRRIPYASR